jgi:hypothetical protein
MTLYKVVETSTVTDEVLERLINEWVSKGWHFDDIKFAMKESSKRPSMAFIIFTQEKSRRGKVK